MIRYEKCMVPNCKGNVIKERSKEKLCPKHIEWLEFLIWAVVNLKVSNENKTPSGIIIPK